METHTDDRRRRHHSKRTGHYSNASKQTERYSNNPKGPEYYPSAPTSRSTDTRPLTDRTRQQLKPISVSVSAPSATIKKSSGGYAAIRVVLRDVFPHHISDIVRRDNKRAADLDWCARYRWPKLQTSFMSGGSSTEPAEEITPEEPFNLNFMNFLNIPAFGNTARIYTEVTFGNDPASGSVELLVDSASGVTWVNKAEYLRAVSSTGATVAHRIRGKEFSAGYTAGSIKGVLRKDDINLNIHSAGHRVTVPRFVFGVVDEKQCPDAERWRTELDVKGVLGIGPQTLSRGAVEATRDRTRKEDLPTIIDIMKKKDIISQIIIGCYIRLPDEGKRQPDDSSSVSSGSDAGTMNAQFHIGGVSRSIYKSETLRMIPATKMGSSALFYGIDLQLKSDQYTVMNEVHGIVDLGSEMIALPESVLDNYAGVVQAASGRKDTVLKYNADHKVYHISRDDFKYLRPLKFNFVKGTNAVFDFLPQQQVFPPGYYRGLIEEDKGDQLYLVFKKLAAGGSQDRRFILGILWMMWYYIIMDASQPEKKLGIAEIEGHTSYRWRGLPKP